MNEKNKNLNKLTLDLPKNSENVLKQNSNKEINKKKSYFKSISLTDDTQDSEIVKIEEKLENIYNEYLANKDKIFPGNKVLNNNYSKMISVLDNDNIFLKDPKEQAEFVNHEVLTLFDEVEEKPKLLTLYSDSLHHVYYI